jgi:outer membrane protein assembly factor BamB
VQKPGEQKQDTLLIPTNNEEQLVAEDFPTLKMEKVFPIPFDMYAYRPLLLQENHFFYRDFDFDTHQEHYLALNIDSKKIQWDKTYPDLEFPRTFPPQLIQDLVLFPSTNGDKYSPESKILALNIDDGSIRWSYQLNSSILGSQSMMLIQNTLFVASWSHLYALDFQTGKLLWSKSIYDYFPGYSKEIDDYHIDAFDSNQNTLFIDYILETDISKPMPSSYYGFLAIEPVKGSILWKYEKKPFERDRFFGESFEVIGHYLLIDGFTLVDPKNGKILWQYKPENPGFKNPKTFYIGYIASAQLLIYQTNHEIGFEKNSSILTGLDISTGQQKWKQDVKEKGNPYYFQNSYNVDQNHQTDRIFTFNSSDHEGETLIDSLDVYDGKDGRVLQYCEIPVSCWFRELKSEIRFHQGWWYFIGTSSQGDILFRFQLR